MVCFWKALGKFFLQQPFSMQEHPGLAAPQGPWIILARTMSRNLLRSLASSGSSVSSGLGGNSAETILSTKSGVTALEIIM